MGRRASRIADKGIHSEFDPKMKRLLDPDMARIKENFWKFKDEVKRMYPNANPLMHMVAKNNCMQCEVRSWTREYLVTRNMNETTTFMMCDLCSVVFEQLCQGKQIRFRLIYTRLPY